MAAEFTHPLIDFNLEPNLRSEELVAQKMYELVRLYGQVGEALVGNVGYHTLMTPRTDFLSEVDQRQIALRLRQVPVLSINNKSSLLGATADYAVIEIQQALPDIVDEYSGWDDQFDWQPYAAAIVRTSDANDVSVIDSRNGRALNNDDLHTVLFVLAFMGKELSNQEFQEGIADMAQNSAEDPTQYISAVKAVFRSVDFLQLSACDDCDTVNIPCEHNPETLN